MALSPDLRLVTALIRYGRIFSGNGSDIYAIQRFAQQESLHNNKSTRTIFM
jgi:hypothetical protein